MPFRSLHSSPGAMSLVVLAALVTVSVSPRSAHGTWSPDSTVHLVVSPPTGSHSGPHPASDGAGGAFVSWTRVISSDYDVLAQHVLADGRLDPAWPAGGLVLATGSAYQYASAAAGDGAGGAYFVWAEWRDATRYDLLAQHVLSDGTLDPAWPAGGAAVCEAVENQIYAEAREDGAGGAFLVWQDERPASGVTDLYAHHLLGSGPDPAWPADGFGVCTAANRQDYGGLIADGSGGMIVTWRDARTDGGDIYAQKVSAAGLPAWTANGLPVCTATSIQHVPFPVSDGAGGAVILWQDLRNSATTGYDVYAQRVLAAGTVDSAWDAGGVVVVNRTGDQTGPRAVSDGAGGALVVWTDTYGGNANVAAQHLLAEGTLDPAWTSAYGTAYPLCQATGTQGSPQVVTDGAGGAMVAWQDDRSGDYDLYASRLRVTVPPTAGWFDCGLAVAVLTGVQSGAVPVAAPGGDAIVFWIDGTWPTSIRAARVSGAFARLGASLPRIAAVPDVSGDQGGHVRVQWEGCAGDVPGRGDVASYRLLRRALVAGAVVWEYITTIPSRGVTGYAYTVETARDSTYAILPWNVFVVRALDRRDGITEHVSPPDSGYSVDDLSPAMPQGLAGEYTDGGVTLSWLANPEPDVAVYRVYAGGADDFVPVPDNRVAEVAGTTFAHVAGLPRFYRLSAVDKRGNEGPFARLDPAQVQGAPPPRPAAPALSNARPNPVRDECVFELALARAGPLALTVYDAGGRLVRVLLDTDAPAGAQTIRWDARDVRGYAVPDGLYFVRFRTTEAQLVRRLVVLR